MRLPEETFPAPTRGQSAHGEGCLRGGISIALGCQQLKNEIACAGDSAACVTIGVSHCAEFLFPINCARMSC